MAHSYCAQPAAAAVWHETRPGGATSTRQSRLGWQLAQMRGLSAAGKWTADSANPGGFMQRAIFTGWSDHKKPISGWNRLLGFLLVWQKQIEVFSVHQLARPLPTDGFFAKTTPPCYLPKPQTGGGDNDARPNRRQSDSRPQIEGESPRSSRCQPPGPAPRFRANRRSGPHIPARPHGPGPSP